MKKRLAILLCLAMVMTVFAVPVLAADTPAVSVVIDGKAVAFDVPPVIEDGRTLVPLRAIFEAVGAAVTWDAATSTATGVKGDTTVIVAIGSVSPTINGVVKPIDVPAKIVDSRTLAPLRFVCEAFGGTVTWDAATYTATVVSAGGEAATPPATETPETPAAPGAALDSPDAVVKAAIAAFAPISCEMTFEGKTPGTPLGDIVYSASGTAALAADKTASSTYAADMGALGKTSPKVAACPFSEIIAGPEADGLAVVSGAVLSDDGANYVLTVTGGACPASLKAIMDGASKDAMTQVTFDVKCDYTIKIDKASNKIVSVEFKGSGNAVTALGSYPTSFTGSATYK